jgi:hypothetical protein
MPKTPGLSTAFAIVVLNLLSGGRTAWAQPHDPLEYKGGPVLSNFKIYPLYYGAWTPAQIKAQQDYLAGLTAYISGVGAPKGEVPMLTQYGVVGASVAKEATANPKASGSLTQKELVKIINNNIGKLHAFDTHTLIMVFPGAGSTLPGCTGCGYHASESNTAFWAVVPQNAGPTLALVTAHEVFESATDPADNNTKGMISKNGQEAVDGCNSPIPKFPFISLSFGQIPGAADNTQGGACNKTGYIHAPEKFNQITFNIATGSDDLRGDSSAIVSVSFPGRTETFTLKSQSDAGWSGSSDHVKTFTIPGPAEPLSLFGPITITLTSHNSFPETDDNWNIHSVDVTVKGSSGSSCVLKQTGNPVSRLTGSGPSVTLYPRKGC